MRKSIVSITIGFLMTAGLSTHAADEVTVPLGAFWAQTGVIKSFGVNSRAVYEAFVEELHAKGGIKLKDGRIGKCLRRFMIRLVELKMLLLLFVRWLGWTRFY